MEGKRGPECLLKPVSNIDFNPHTRMALIKTTNITNSESLIKDVAKSGNVSATAVGLLTLILVNDGLNIKQDKLMQRAQLKRVRFVKARRELQEAGYLTVNKVPSRVNYEWVVKGLNRKEEK